MSWPEVTNHPSFPDIDREVLERWQERDVFHESLRLRADGPVYSFYEGPPTANGRPGTHHVEARVFKDIFPRYRTMKGYRVPRKAGWDCHGLPVELEVEKELGLNSKAEIEEFGIEEFNRRCRESVTRYVGEFEDVTERIGFWVDMPDAYWTMDTSYVESVWWAMQRLWEEGLIFEDHRVAPYCARCGTALSDAEVAQGYQTIEDPSVYVRFPILDGPFSERGVSLLVWTTTPWTLPGNVAVAVGPGVDYVLARGADGHEVVVARARVEAALGQDAEILEDVETGDLIGLHYEAPFTIVAVDGDHRYVVAADVVTTTEGSGLVHMAPAFGADDMAIGRREGLPVVNPVDLDGRFATGPWAGTFVKDADPAIMDALEDVGVLTKRTTYEHTYPFCWRCDTPLIYYAKLSWYIATTARRDELLAANAKIDWYPEHIRGGRFGNWLENNVDWALSRDRYWGTPLPFWRCPQGHLTVVGSLSELGGHAGRDLSDLDPHRPYVDEIAFVCPEDGCDDEATRVPEVADAWFDSGAMPFAQFGYPHRGKDEFSERFPADFICEGIDQTRGWFYTLLAESTLLFGESSYRTCLCLGHIVDEGGRKMSKSIGNVLDPWELLDRSGADALRWLMLTEGNPWLNRRVGPHLLDEIVRQFLLTLWNTHYFFTTYANIDGFSLDDAIPAVADRHVMDRWVLAELTRLVEDVDAALERYDVTAAGRALEDFVDDLSNWYVRRSRRRFWKAASEDPADKAAAYATLHTCLTTAAQLLAPFVPFVSDQLWEDLVRSQDDSALPSVHLTDFPTPDGSLRDEELRDAMATVRRAVELGRQARNESGVKVRQPLPQALITVPASEREGLRSLLEEVADELNVKEVRLTDATTELAERSLKPNFRALGPAFQQHAPTVADALRGLGPDEVERIVAELHDGDASLDVDGTSRAITRDMVEIVETPKTGWVLTGEGSTSFALDVEIDDELRTEGQVRELMRAVNDLRKERELALDDRIELAVAIEPSTQHDSFAPWWDDLTHEVLATELTHERTDDATEVQLDEGVRAWISLDLVS
ncbi:MAG: isoleucine--tRNA ligase [Actinobacteria bacterium]|nr:isoleucine--tRNA ligase [Actinomycetota bacterium]